MQNSDQPAKDSAKLSGSSSSFEDVKSSEKFQSSALLSENVVYTEEKHSSYNSYYLSYDNVNEASSFSTQKHNSKSSAFSTNSKFKVGDKISESSTLVGQKPLVASFEYSPSGKCIKSNFPLKSIHSNSFPTPERTAISENSFKSGINNRTIFKGASNFGSNRQYSSFSKHKSSKNIYKSPSSNFVCCKCGLGYPCTLFLCKRAKTFSSGNVKQETPIDCINSSRNKDADSSVISDWRVKDVCPSNIVLPKHSSIIDTSEIASELNSSKRNLESCSPLPAKKSCQASSRKSVEDLINRLFPEQKNKQLIPNGKELPKKNKLSKRKSNESNIILGFESTKRSKDISFTNDIKSLLDGESVIQSVTVNKDNVSNLGRAVTPAIGSYSVIGSNRSNFDKDEILLSQETRNFLNELAASSPSSHFDDILTSQNSQTNPEISDETDSTVLTFSNSQTFRSEKSGESIESAVLPLPNALVFRSEIRDESESAVLTLPNSQTFSSEKSCKSIESAVLPLPNALFLSSGISDETKSTVLTLPCSKTFNSDKNGESIESEDLPLQNALVLSSEIRDETESAVLTFPKLQTFSLEKSGKSKSAVLPFSNLSSGISNETESAALLLRNSQTLNSEKSGERTEAVFPLPNALVLSSEISDESESANLTLSNSQTFSSEKNGESAQSAILTLPSSQNFTSEISVKTVESVISTATNSQILNSEASDQFAPLISLPSNSHTLNSKLNKETKQFAVSKHSNSRTLSSEASEIIESEILTPPNSEPLSLEINCESYECVHENSKTSNSEITGKSIDSAVLPLRHTLTLRNTTETVVSTLPNSQILTTTINSESSESLISSPANSQNLNSEFCREIIPVISASSNLENFDSESNHETKPSVLSSLPNSLSFISKTDEIIECESSEISGGSTDYTLQNSQSYSSEICAENIKSTGLPFPNELTSRDETESIVLTFSNPDILSTTINSETSASVISTHSNSQALNSEFNKEIIPVISSNSETLDLESKLSSLLPVANSIALIPEASEITECDVLTIPSSEINVESTKCKLQNSQSLSSEISRESIDSAALSLPDTLILNSETNEETESAVLILSNLLTLCSEISIETSDSASSTFSKSQSEFIPDISIPSNAKALSSKLNSETKSSAVLTLPNSQTFSTETGEIVECEVLSLAGEILNSEISDESTKRTSQNSQTLSSEIAVETVETVLTNSQNFNTETSEIIECEVLTCAGETLNLEINDKSAKWAPQDSQTLSSEISVEAVESVFSNSQTFNTETSEIIECEVLTLARETLNPEISEESAKWIPQDSQTLSAEIIVETVGSVVSALPNSQTLSGEIIECEDLALAEKTLNSEISDESAEWAPKNSQTLSSVIAVETEQSLLSNSQAFNTETNEIIECEVLTLAEETLNPEISDESAKWVPQNSQTLSSEVAVEIVESVLSNSQTFNTATSEILECEVLTLAGDTLNPEISGECAKWIPQDLQTLSSEITVETVESAVPALPNSQTSSKETSEIIECEDLTLARKTLNPEINDESVKWSPRNSQTLSSVIAVETEQSLLSNSQTFNTETSEIIECEVLTLAEETLNPEISDKSAKWTPRDSQILSSKITVETLESAVSALSNSQTFSTETSEIIECGDLTLAGETLSPEVSVESSKWAPQDSQTLSSEITVETEESAVSALPNLQTFSTETSEIIECEVSALAGETLNPKISDESAKWTPQDSQTLSSEIAVETVESALLNSQTLSSEVTNEAFKSAGLIIPNTQTLSLKVISESTESVSLVPSNSQTLDSDLHNETKSVWTPEDSETCILETHGISQFEEVLTIPLETIRPLRSSESVAWIPENSQISSLEATGETPESANCKLPNSQVLNSETFCEAIESVVLTLPNSESLSLETSNEIVIESDVCENKMSVSNEDEEHCNFTDVNKDLTNALDMIQQSSIYDKGLSSAEICNSLNEIFSENDSGNLSVNEVPNSETIQTEETVIDMETSHTLTSADVNNESEIYLQTTSDPSVSADTETYIKLSDLQLGDNSDNFQNILIIQDEDGNIETLYILQDSNVGEDGVVLAEGLNVEGNTANADNILVGNSVDELQKLLISQGITNAADILTLQNSVNDQIELDNLTAVDSASTVQVNLEEYQNHSDIGNSSEVMTLLAVKSDELPVTEDQSTKNAVKSDELPVTEDQSTENNHLSILPTKCLEELDNIKDISIKVDNISEESSDKVENIAEDSSDKVENILLTLSNNRDNFLDVNPDKNTAHSSADNQSVCESSRISDIKDNKKFEYNDLEKIELSQKAKKSISHIESKVQNTIQHSDYKMNSVLTEKSNQLSELTQNSSLGLPGSSKTAPVNGAVYHSDLNYTDSRAVSYKSSNVTNSFLSSQFKNFLSQKSKKTVSSDNLKRSAKKSFCGSVSSSELHYMHNDNLIHNQAYSSLNSLALKRRIEENKLDEYNCHKRIKQNMLDTFDVHSTSKNSWSKNRLIALKTFKKPFTSAKKSVLDPREGAMSNLRNKALKTCAPRSSVIKTAMKSVARKQAIESVSSDSHLLSRHSTSKIVNMKQNSSLGNNSELKTFIQPEICEIRILPNDYLKRASSLLLNQKNMGLENADENMSDEEIKMSSGCNSPVRELMSLKSTCSCNAQEVPCICNDSNLQLICEGEDSMDNNIVPCVNSVSQQYLLTPSSEVKHRAFCDNHISRLRQHHCCPKCGIFCSQGEFLRCASDESENKENHLFHVGCFIIPAAGLPPSCPHCCKFSSFNVVSLLYKSSADSELQEVPSDSQKITHNLKDCDIYMSVHQTPKTVTVSESKIFVPGTNEMQQMITSLAEEKTLRLRPTGKCLYNPIRTGDVQKVMQLIGNGVNPNHKFRMHSNNTPLHVAAYYGWIGILHILIQAGALIDAVNDDLETPLIVAVERKQLPIIRYLIHAGAQIDVKDCNGMTCFHIACKNGFKEIAEFLYETGRIDVNLQDDGGWTSLVWACEHKHLGLVRWLLDIGSDPNVRDNEENTVLHWAAYSGESEIAQLFLNKGCTLSYVNKHGDSALHIAAREDNFECVRLFATKGAVLDQKNKSNQTPLMCCEDDSLSFNYLCQCISSGALKLKKMQLEKHVVFRDISRGAESYPIQAINEVDEEEFIMEFRYVVKNCHRTGVEIISSVNNMQLCYCKDNCITRDCACTMNSKCWYDANGCLSADFDVFWPPTIFECNKTCHCPKTCINRVVQQGLRCPLQLYRTRFQGWGVRTLQDVPKGAFVCEYVGELITGSEATDRDDDTYFFDLESQDADYCLDGRYYGNVARFLNHSCEPNLIAVKVFVDYQDLNFPRIAFFTLRHIKAFEELCFDYGLDFWIVKSQSILCTCNTPSCKYSKDTIDETLQKFFMDTKAENEMPSESVLTTT